MSSTNAICKLHTYVVSRRNKTSFFLLSRMNCLNCHETEIVFIESVCLALDESINQMLIFVRFTPAGKSMLKQTNHLSKKNPSKFGCSF